MDLDIAIKPKTKYKYILSFLFNDTVTIDTAIRNFD